VDWQGAGDTRDPFDSLDRILSAAVSISLLAYVLHRRRQSLRSIGLTARLSDIPLALAVTLASSLVANALSPLLFGHLATAKTPSMAAPHLLKWLSVVPAAAKEDLIVRAFLITEVAGLTGSMGIAVLASVGFQTLYHLYQGTPEALYHTASFFVASVFYASTRRITPVILAHSLHNFLVFAR
jgi:membrane protease YdiL (CAAX protease family)